jgi:hypothetical protein
MRPLPWSKLRQGQRLLRLAERYTPERLDAACARALGFELIDVRRLERILVLALEHVADQVLLGVPQRRERKAERNEHREPADHGVDQRATSWLHSMVRPPINAPTGIADQASTIAIVIARPNR